MPCTYTGLQLLIFQGSLKANRRQQEPLPEQVLQKAITVSVTRINMGQHQTQHNCQKTPRPTQNHHQLHSLLFKNLHFPTTSLFKKHRFCGGKNQGSECYDFCRHVLGKHNKNCTVLALKGSI